MTHSELKVQLYPFDFMLLMLLEGMFIWGQNFHHHTFGCSSLEICLLFSYFLLMEAVSLGEWNEEEALQP